MQFLDLSRENSKINWQEVLAPVFESQKFINGPQVEQFEVEVAKYLNCKYALGVSSGTDALLVALMALGVSRGSRVLTTPYSFVATVEAPVRLGAEVEMVDLGVDSFLLDVSKVKETLQSKDIDVFLPVHLFGEPFPIDQEIIDICLAKNIKIVEDAAQSFGSTYNGKKAGILSPMSVGCFSFFPSKNLGCVGDGGLIATNEQVVYERARAIRNHGALKKYSYSMEGGNFRLDTLQAAILLAKLPYVDDFIDNRRETATFYNSHFLSSCYDLIIPGSTEITNVLHSFNQYVINVIDDKRNKLARFLAKKEIPTMIYYPSSLDVQPCYRDKSFFDGHYQNSSVRCFTNLALPIAHLTQEEKEKVVTAVSGFFSSKEKI